MFEITAETVFVTFSDLKCFFNDFIITSKPQLSTIASIPRVESNAKIHNKWHPLPTMYRKEKEIDTEIKTEIDLGIV